ncbi:MAG: GNAT family N-acetyltransferase [Bryobacterales bacterium]
MSSPHLRVITAADRAEVAELIYASINAWYRNHGLPEIFRGGPAVTEVFYDTYNALEPGCCVVAENTRTGRLMGSCFYHPRERHVALGIMNVHPNYFGCGVGRALLQYICDYTDRNGYKSLRLTQSALNLDSFSLYNRAGFVPRHAYQDMLVSVPAAGLDRTTPGLKRCRDARIEDVPAIQRLEETISGITREQDYRFIIGNQAGFWHASVYEDENGGIEGFLASSGHPALNMLGPGFTRTEEQAAALILRELQQYRGRTPLVVVPAERSKLVHELYGWGARNCELHFCQVRGEFEPFQGLNFPTFILETA